MKKLLMVLMSALMVLTVGVTSKIEAATGGIKIVFRDNVNNETSQTLEYKAPGDEFKKTADDIDGYEFVNWEVKQFHHDEQKDVTVADPTNKELKFTVPSFDYWDGDEYMGVVVIATYKEKPQAEVKNGDNIGDITKEEGKKIVDAIKEAGYTVNDTDEVVIKAETTSITLTDDQKSLADKYITETKVELTDSVDYKFKAIITTEDGAKTETGELGDVGTKLPTTLPVSIDSSLLTAPSGYTRKFWAIIDHGNGNVKKYECTEVAADHIVIDVQENSEVIGMEYKDVENPKDNGSSTSGETHVSCEEYNHSNNWTWSETKGRCIYRVANTSSK